MRVGGVRTLVQTRAAQELLQVALAQSVVVTIRETMAWTRGRIVKMRVRWRRRMVMAWARVEKEEVAEVAEVEREVGVLARRQRRVPTT